MDEQDALSRDELAAKQARVSGSWQSSADNEAASKLESMSRLILPTEDGLIYIYLMGYC
jgi:hypothetical protein